MGGISLLNWINKLKVSNKLILLTGISLFGMIIISLISVVSYNIMNSNVDRGTTSNTKALILINDISSEFWDLKANLYKAVLSEDESSKSVYIQDFENNISEINSNIDEFNSIIVENEKADFNDFLNSWDELNDAIDSQKDNLNSNNQDIYEFQNSIDSKSANVETALKNIQQIRSDEISLGLEISKGRKTQITLIIILLTIVIITLCSIVAIYISKNISNALTKTAKYAKIVESGDLSNDDLIIKTKDELGTMINAFNNMKNGLRHVVKKIIETCVGIKLTVKALNESIVQNFHAIEQINRAVEEIASHSEEHTAEMSNLSRNIGKLYNKTNTISGKLKNIDVKNTENSNEIIEIFSTFREDILNLNISGKNIYELSERFAANNEEIAATLEEQVGKLREMVNRSNTLLANSKELEDSVSIFKLPDNS
jgi:methyl-accepting chemotaxis protein